MTMPMTKPSHDLARMPPEVLIMVKVLPRSSVNEVQGKEEGAYRIKLTAPPVDGRGNRALVDVLQKRLGIPGRDIQIVRGERARRKAVLIRGLAREEIEKRLLHESSVSGQA